MAQTERHRVGQTETDIKRDRQTAEKDRETDKET